MRLQAQVLFQNMERSPAVESAVHERLAKLEQFCADITSCRVGVELVQKHQHQGRPYAVRIDLTLPGQEIVVDRVVHEDVYVALRDAFDDMKRRLEDAVRRRRDQQQERASIRRPA